MLSSESDSFALFPLPVCMAVSQKSLQLQAFLAKLCLMARPLLHKYSVGLGGEK